ncbi:uncharacterized protein LOC122374047 [Amphibalanus amphitrite]|uniref:uncharacterized protein LOC122374047 n=1 Tax=Amphibalanus amphitrite TaxID=1232801 RepID=UPI001C922FF9|nr:uncharacterized protein LOC122374047 [Amphibalanus amphitrite]
MLAAVFPCKLKLRNVYRLLNSRRSWEDLLLWTDEAVADLRWWIESLDGWNGRVLLPPAPFDVQLSTDASASGWGALLSDPAGKAASGFWTVSNHVMLTAHHISGESNVQPDALSRLPLRHEWYLHPEVFRQLDRMFGPHSIDRFATCTTALLPVYNSRFSDPGTAGVDALGQPDWAEHNNFVNPPFRLIPRVLDTIEAYRAVATLIAPFWPAQPWMDRLRRMSIAPPLRLPPVVRACVPLLPGYETIEPHRNPRWRLYAWRICGARN